MQRNSAKPGREHAQSDGKQMRTMGHFQIDPRQAVYDGPYYKRRTQRERALWYGVPLMNGTPQTKAFFKKVRALVRRSVKAFPPTPKRAILLILAGAPWWVVAEQLDLKPFQLRRKLNNALNTLELQLGPDHGGKGKPDARLVWFCVHVCFLSAKQQEVMWLWLEGKTPQEIAEQLHVDRGTIRKRLHDARHTLRKRIKYHYMFWTSEQWS